MAIAVGSVSNTPLHGNRTNTTVTAPTGIANGDLLVAVLFVGHASALPLLTVTPPAGWSEVTNSPSGIDAPDPYEVSVRVYSKVASGESGNYTFTHANADTQGYMYRLTGADTTTPIDATPAAAVWTTGTGQTTTYGSVTTVTNGCFLIFAEADWDGPGSGTVSGTTPSITVRRAGTVTWVGDGTQTTAGATGSRTRTNGNSAAAVRWASIAVPIRPAGAGGGSTTPQTVSATSASAVVIVKRAGKTVSAASSDVTTVTKQAGKGVTVLSATATAASKRAGKGISAVSVTSALANATRAFLKTVAATVSSSVSAARQARKVVGASLAGSVAIRKAITHSVAVLASGAVTATKRAAKSFSAGCAASASVVKSIGKSLSASLSLAAAFDYVVNFVLRVITPSPIDGRRIAFIAHENRRAETAADPARTAQASVETRAASALEENRSASAQPNSRSVTPSTSGRQDTV